MALTYSAMGYDSYDILSYNTSYSQLCSTAVVHNVDDDGIAWVDKEEFSRQFKRVRTIVSMQQEEEHERGGARNRRSLFQIAVQCNRMHHKPSAYMHFIEVILSRI